jgi:hypothetical protein
MALITDFSRVEKKTQKIHEPVECGYSVFRDRQGEIVLQLDTYGTSERKLTNKVSQSIQLDEAAARELLKIITSTFQLT